MYSTPSVNFADLIQNKKPIKHNIYYDKMKIFNMNSICFVCAE